mgnify:CR=1 FL=1
MEYLALYRKYRPTKFSDVVSQESILKILTNSIKEGKISHAYLFSGPRGTGKTTIAKLLAKTVNCLNLNDDLTTCGKCENCLDILNNSSDIIEIDAASNNGVDEIRELKSKINLVPSKLKYKVYIIDEVHMLSISAFNALLKTLEEPPSHVIFILATTEFYKVPVTIVSRCQCLSFTRIKTSSIEARLKEIANLEKIPITDEAIHEIAVYSDGGMRDALGMLDKLSSYSLEKITLNDFLSINGLISKTDLDDFIQSILSKNNEEVIQKLNQFDELGYDFSKLIEMLMKETRDLLVNNYILKTEKYNSLDLSNLIICLNETYNMLKEAANRRIIFEVKLLSFMNTSKNTIIPKTVAKNAEVEPLPTDKEKLKNISQEIPKKEEFALPTQKTPGNKNNCEKKYQIDEHIKRQRINNTFALASKLLKNIVLTNWKNLNNYLTDLKYGEVAGLLKDCEVGVVSNTNMILVSKYESVIEKVYENYTIVLELLKKIQDNDYVIVLLNETDFQNEVLNYKEHMHDKNYYTYQAEEKPFITYLSLENQPDLCYGNLVQKAIDVFGKEYVQIEEER